MNANHLICTALLLALPSGVGCQSWQGAAFPLPNATRVPPPGTGTYQLPSGYYNNSTSALPAAQATQTAAAAPTLRPATGGFPTTNMPATNLASASFSSSPVVTASHNQFSDSSAQYTQPAVSQNSLSDTSGAAAANLGGSSTSEVPSLQWQQFGGQ